MSEKLWGGCFSKDIDQDVLHYTLTTDIDTRLIRYDLWGSMAHLIMLARCKIVSDNATARVLPALLKLYTQCKEGKLTLDPALEDVHLNMERLIIDEVGAENGGRLHTARSRNDQVVTDTRMYLRSELLSIQQSLGGFIDGLISLAEGSTHKLAVGYTHLQPAQPISLAFWYSAYASIFMRDLERISSAFENTNRNVLGACALAGTSFPIDRGITKRLLGFDRQLEHSLDATSSRDFVVQALSAFAMLMSNFSRLAEEIVIWNSHEFGLLKVDDAFATGSSIMPQKKNPVVAELIKGRVGRVYGALMQILTTTKGVTLGYNCDLQEDKPLLWDAIDTIKTTTHVLHKHIESSTYNIGRAEELNWKNFSTVTELANMLVTAKQLPFREAHRLTGILTQELIAKTSDLRDIGYVRMFLESHSITTTEAEILECVSPGKVMERQCSLGSTGPASVQHMLVNLRRELSTLRESVDARAATLAEAETKTLSLAHEVSLGNNVSDCDLS